MLIEDKIVVRAPAADVWRFLLDLPAVASCLPGARFDERIDDRTYDGALRMKIGPIAMRYRGRIVIEDVNEDAREATLFASAKDEGGGTVSARMRWMVAAAGADTDVHLWVDVSLTGRAAQFGRNIVEDVSRVMIGKMATEVGLRLSHGGAPAATRSEREQRTSALPQPALLAAPAPSERVVGAAAFATPGTGPLPSPGNILFSERRAESLAPTGSGESESELNLGSLGFTIARARIRALRRWVVGALGRLFSGLGRGRGRR